MEKKTDTIAVESKGAHITVTVTLFASIKKEENLYVSECPSLQICSQGSTKKEASKNIIEAVELFIESCVARGKLSEALKKRGFLRVEDLSRAERRRQQRSKTRSPQRAAADTIKFPVELPLAA